MWENHFLLALMRLVGGLGGGLVYWMVALVDGWSVRCVEERCERGRVKWVFIEKVK